MAAEKKNEVQVMDVTSLQMQKQEIDTQIATARHFPRNEDRAIQKSIKLATSNPRIAQDCFYFRPVGKKDGIQQFADGGSIRVAEILKITWGNIRVAKRVIGTRDGSVGVEWAVHDLESNMMDRGEVWRPYFNSEKMIPVITAAALKFAEREAVFAAVPKAHADTVLEECRRMIVGEGEDKAKLYQHVVSEFEEMGVTIDEMLSVVNRKDYAQGSDGELVFLIGVYNCIKDEACKLSDVFGGEEERKSRKPVLEKKTTRKTKEAPEAPAPAPDENKPTPATEDDFVLTLRKEAAKVGFKADDNIIGFTVAELNIKGDIKTLADISEMNRPQVLELFRSMQKAE